MNGPSAQPAIMMLSARQLQEINRILREGDSLIHYRNAEHALQVHVLSNAEEVTIGRRPASGIPLGWDLSVSRIHAVLRRFDVEWAIEDGSLSRNGTFVNGGRARGSRRLRDGDVIMVGSVSLTFRSPQPTLMGRTVTNVASPAHIPLTDAQRRVLAALCRPLCDGVADAGPAANRQIAEELFISVETVKSHMRSLAQVLSVDHLPQTQRRYAMAATALRFGLVPGRRSC